MDGPQRTFVTSDFLRLELLPKPLYFGHTEEVSFYEDFFDSAQHHVASSAELLRSAFSEAKAAGLSAVDALHVSAAKRASVDEFVTAEKRSKPFFRVKDLRVVPLLRGELP